jgi:rare lipoprotein A
VRLHEAAKLMYDGAAMSVAVVSPRHVSGTFVRICSAVLALALVSACASTHRGSGVAQRGIYKIGAPYSIDGITYYPQEEFQHVETGVASWYGPGFHGKSTANGERYDQQEHTAAHRTLQMPSVVRVTNLDNGLSTVVRVNDRGPYARNRVLDVSRAAAQELDMMKSGTARVRIEQLTTESQVVKEVALNGGGPSEQRDAIAKATPPPVVQVQAAVPNNPRSPAVTPMQVSGAAGNSGPSIASLAVATPQPAGGFYVQTGSFSTADNAERQRGLVRSYGLSEISQASAAGRDVFRVRLGPYTTSDAAGIVADRLKRSGYGDARVVVE